MPYCWRCKAPFAEFRKTPDFHETCGKCQSYWHSCCNCANFTGYPSARCRLPNIEAVHDVGGANFCDEFRFNEPKPQGNGRGGKVDPAVDARRKWDELFKDR